MQGQNKKIIIYHIINIILLLGLCAFAYFYCNKSIMRLIEAGKDLGTSFCYYFGRWLGKDITPTITNYSIYLDYSDLLPKKWESFKLLIISFWNTFISMPNFLGYSSLILKIITVLVMSFPVIILLIVIAVGVFKELKKEKINYNYNKDTLPLKIYKFIENLVSKIYNKIKIHVMEIINIAKKYNVYSIMYKLIFFIMINIVSIIFEIIAYSLYISGSFNFSNIYIQFYKLFCDLFYAIKLFPWPAIPIIIYVLICKQRKAKAYDRLNHMELKNKGFINSLPIVTMNVGAMGTDKTKTMTDMVLSTTELWRTKMLDFMYEDDLKFPFFPWINLENEIKLEMEKHNVYNLASCEEFIKIKYKEFKETGNLFDYDYNKYSLYYDSKLKNEFIFEVLRDYTKLYFMYIIESSLIISNYSIREDSIIDMNGNFPRWYSDFFQSSTQFQNENSKRSHILNFDMLRLGKKVVEESSDCFEFGIFVITEGGKERGNKNDMEGVKKNSDETNQKNDGFNLSLKMCRHAASVHNFPFIRFFIDEQRAESWGADARDLCEVIHMDKSSDLNLAIKTFDVELFIYNLLANFQEKYYNYRYYHGNNTLPMYINKKIVARYNSYFSKMSNIFGYYKKTILTEHGSDVKNGGGELEKHDYYLMPKKIYSDRYSTDCFSDYFSKMSLRSNIGINDIPTYKKTKASSDELRCQESYFINDIFKD